jgi:hypothetical protein
MFSQSGEWLNSYERADAPISWTITELSGGTNSGTLDKSTGYTANFTGTKARQTVRVIATFVENGTTLSDSITITIVPGPAAKLVIEPDATGLTAYPNDPSGAHRAGTVTIAGTAQTLAVYAVLRDQWGNFISFSNPTVWTARNAAAVDVAGGDASLGEGILQRKAQNGQAWVIAQGQGFADSVLVNLSAVYYTALRIVTGDSTGIDNLTLTLDQSQEIKVQGLRSDGGGWEYVNGNWSITNGLNTATPAPASSINWVVAPTDTGSGMIRVTMGTAPPDSVAVHFVQGAPYSIVLYPLDGAPSAGNQPYPDPLVQMQDSAGHTVTMVAKVFDKAGIWLGDYDRSNSPVTWTVVEFAANKTIPTGTLSLVGGYKTGFLPTTAYNTVYIIATFSEDGITCRDSLQLHIVSGAATHLSIEATWDSTVSLNADKRMVSVTFTSNMLKDSVYAVLRDSYGNYVAHATQTAWTTANAAVATAAAARTALGEGEITRHSANNAATYVTAIQGAFKDSVQVILNNTVYSEIQIVVRGTVRIDSLAMGMDEDTTISAIGLRADGSGIWDDIQVTWGNSAGLSFNNPAPPSAVSWNFSPAGTPATGKIFIVWGTGAQQRSDTITAVFSYGNPAVMALYPAPGQPNAANAAYPATITVVAGQPLPLVAKLFTESMQWLAGYERINAPFTWSIEELTGATGSGTLDKYTGFQATFTGYKAYQTVKVTATFAEGAITLSKSITITITPGPAAMLVIEPDTTGKTAYPNDAHRAGQVSILGTDTSLSAYAVLRDQFGNFVGFSNPTGWLSRDPAQAAVRNGDMVIGEGILLRRTALGQAWVTAVDGTDANFKDSVLVVLSNIFYTQLRIVVRNSTKIDSLTLAIEEDTALSVQGLRSDGTGWENVPAAWHVTSGLTTSAAPPGASISWTVAPTDTGSGHIYVSLGTATPDSIVVRFLHGVPRSIALYAADGDPKTMVPYPDPNQPMWDSAGTPIPVVAKVFDRAGIWLNSYERGTSPVTWNIVELAGNTDIPTGSLTPATGYKASVTPIRFNNSIWVIGEFQENGQTYLDTIRITVLAGKIHHLVLENDPRMEASPHSDNPDTLVEIPSNEKFGVIYAVIRDQYQNFISASQRTAWQSLDTAVVTVADGQKSLGQGVISRIDSAPRDRAKVVATSLDYPGLGLRDTTTALVLQYYYLALRIVAGSGATHILSLDMNTNQDTTLWVQGQRSIDSLWEYVAVKWESSQGLSIVPAAPATAESWAFSPDKPGTGTIRVTLGTDTVTTKPDFITVNFTKGPPVVIETEILTPPSQRIAGDTIIAVTRIRNKDGFVPGVWCDSVTYQNALVTGGRPSPTVTANSVSVTMGTTLHECFQDGIDTVKYVLYYAPASADSMEKVMVTMGGLSAVSSPFTMHPGALTRIAIEDNSGADLDSVHLTYPTGSKLFTSAGYDAYGNRRGLENSDWTASGTLHAIDIGTNVTSVFYESRQVKNGEAGYITAAAAGPGGKAVTDSVWVTITEQPPALKSVVTQDVDGDGYLDRLILHFDGDVTWPDSSYHISFSGAYNDPVTGETVTYSSLTVNSVSAENSTNSGSVFIVYLAEPSSGNLQTGWTPKITISGLADVDPASVTNITAKDGAGPVIWGVTKTINSVSSRTQDKVTVTFSEPIGTNGNDFNTSLPPSGIIRVWEKQHVTMPNGTVKDTLVEVPGMLAGITEFFQVNNNIQVEFYMSNDSDLTSLNYLSLFSDSNGKSLSDRSSMANVPAVDNRRVQVKVSGTYVRQIIAVPNPSTPTFVRVPRGELHLAHESQARRWVREDGAGSIMTFTVTPDSGELVKAFLKIFDMVGNLVYSVDSSNSTQGIIPQDMMGPDSINIDIYWNGSNQRGLKCAAGVYRPMLALKYMDKTTGRTRMVSKLQGTVGLLSGRK